ncbi:MAG: tRNA 2-selenouridine(34) synthase MnmH, partial [Burkholderiaceae bacterium]
PRLSLQIVCGPTGSGKSRLLQALAAAGAQVLDLERLAAHRGSVLGGLPGQPQPTQKAFESRIWDTLRRFDPSRVVFAESESRRIGRLQVPPALIEAMRAAPCIALELPAAARIRLLLQDYAHFVHDPDRLGAQLDGLIALHGRATIAHWRQLAQSGALPALVGELLERHYDPAYRRSIDRNFAGARAAMTLALDDIGDAAFAAAARRLHEQADTAVEQQ